MNPGIASKAKSSERTLNTGARKNSSEGKDKTSKTRQRSKTKGSERTLNTSSKRKSQEGLRVSLGRNKEGKKTMNKSQEKSVSSSNKSKDRGMSTGRNMSLGRSRSTDQNRGSSAKGTSLTKERNTSQSKSKDRDSDLKNIEPQKRKSQETLVQPMKTKSKSPQKPIKEPVLGFDEKYFQITEKQVICLVCPGANKITHKKGVVHMNTEKHKKNVQISNKEPEQETPNSKKKTDNNISQFGRLRKNRSSWIDMSSDTPSFQTPVPVKKKKPNIKKKTTDMKKTSQEEAIIKEPEKVRRLVKNPFKTLSSKEALKLSKVCF